jgi:hypothetical protein
MTKTKARNICRLIVWIVALTIPVWAMVVHLLTK